MGLMERISHQPLPCSRRRKRSFVACWSFHFQKRAQFVWLGLMSGPGRRGARYGTILVDLEQRRIAGLLPERSVESSTAWFKKHAEVKMVSRDRGKIFREAASRGAPQAKQVVDRFHLQKNFAEALEKFFGHHKRVLKKAAQQLAGKTLPPPKTAAVRPIEQERKRRFAERVRRHKKIWKLFRAGYRKEDIAQMVGVGSRSVYRTLEHEQPPTRHRRHWTHHVVDPYVSYLTTRWNEGCHTARELYEEIVAQGYSGSLRAIERIVAQLRPYGPKWSPNKQSHSRKCLLHAILLS
jgi:hypothetical protein